MMRSSTNAAIQLPEPAPEPKDAETVTEAAADALEQSDNVLDAAGLLERRAVREPALRDALLAPFLSQACYQAVSLACRHSRRKIWTAPNYTKGGNGQRVVAHAKSLLDFPLPGGLRLRDATKKEVLAGANVYGQYADDMAGKARWLKAIAERLSGRKKVATVLSESELEDLREKSK